MADNIEHVISYWVVFQKLHSPALAGFAVLSHWLPFLLFSVAVGGLADRFDPRRIIQCGMLLFIVASTGWGIFFITATLQMWGAMLLLVIHGCAGVLWPTPPPLLLYDIAGPAQMPGFADNLGHGDPGVSYSVLLAADAAGALLAGSALEAGGRLKPRPQTAIGLAGLWGLSWLAFAAVGIYALAIALLFAAGFF